MKPKQNYTHSEKDLCQTPPYALEPLIPYIKSTWLVWEPAAGEGLLAKTIYKHCLSVISGDIQTGENFFKYSPVYYSAQITNPPYRLKYKWLKRSYELGKPFALLVPVEVLGAIQAQELFAEYGVEIILMNQRIDFKMPNKGWDGLGAQFPTMWVTWKFNLGQQIIFADIKQAKKKWKQQNLWLTK